MKRTTNRFPGWLRTALWAPILALAPTLALGADAPPEIDSGDTAWILTSSALVLMMTVPGLAFFYGGLVRSKNVLSTLMHSFVMMAAVSVVWVLWGYSTAFGPDIGSLVGNPFTWFGLSGVGLEATELSGTIPHQAFMVFQLMFAIITPALISGAIAERMRFPAYLLFMVLWSTFIYAPLCHWVWGGGWIGDLGALDFAGGTVVHISSGVSALVACMVLGPRRGYPAEPMAPHNLPFTVLGAALLWVGWFGFNAGSALAADGIATAAFVNTNTATAAAVLGWMFTEWTARGRPTALGAATGAVAGLVAITPAAGFVSPLGSLAIGAIAGFLCYNAVNLKMRLGYDDSLDVVGVHGVGGTWGAVATGLFAIPALAGENAGLFHGNPGQVLLQVYGVIGTIAFCAVGTFILLKIVDALVGLRVTEEDEVQGLDLTQHSETAYTTMA